ncbi:Detected protein of unknown function [Hibiscus syriacus]|uniref:DUF7804 domain-containing protein n=1 Tax=Hibiscus syriacus TaxID=106335 RepID=A0A6A3C025_HIBSY|nr:uncharacterized protein LOC120208000 [Hibiscus syriacus]KAE8721597.1 Detected protein of unknown function [Hibiscus syriacus]
MQAASGVCCGGDAYLKRHDSFNLFNFHKPNVRPRRFMFSNPQPPSNSKPIKSKMQPSESSSMIISLQPLAKQEKKKRNDLLYEKIDEWMRVSVAEIVKKLPESPLLVHVFLDVKNNTTETRTEKAEEDKWALVKQKWENGESPMPDGLIFVEQIEQHEEVSGSSVWGIVVQGIGAASPLCYLLKTSRVDSGLGSRCTHFCLVRVKSFKETAFSQLHRCWL